MAVESVHDLGNFVAQSGEPPMPVNMSIGVVVTPLAFAISGTSFGYTELMTVWLAPILSSSIRGGGMAT